MKQKRTAPGPDEIPYWIWKDYASYLAPMVTKIVNLSLHQQHVPLIWKLANITPMHKESPLGDCSQLRPISLTNTIIRIVERIIFKEEISLQAKMLIEDQHAYKEGYKYNNGLNYISTTLAKMARGVLQGTVLVPFLFFLKCP